MLGLRIPCKYCITDTGLGDRLESCDNIADLSFVESFARSILGTKTPNLEYFYLGTCVDEFEFVSFFYLTGKELQIYYNSLVRIILRVEYEGFCDVCFIVG